MATIYGTEKTRELFENIPEFNSGSISYSRFQFGNVGFGNNTDVINISSAQFDFITSLSLSIELPALTTANHITHPGGYISWINNVGHAIIETISIDIDGNKYDEYNGDYIHCITRINGSKHKLKEYDEMIGNNDKLNLYSLNKDETILRVPLLFWFCNDIGLSLPIIKIQEKKIM